MERNSSFWHRVESYKLKNNFVVILVLVGIFIASALVYLVPDWRENVIVGNVALAFMTSLLATIFAMIAEMYVKYKSLINDKFLEDIHWFGIENMTVKKKDFIKNLLKECRETIWISGYRLIMTDESLRDDIYDAVERGATVTAVLCPPWEYGFKLVYGENEKVMDNYFYVFKTIYDASIKANIDPSKHKIFFIKKPLFSDTYKIDQNLITGPYMNNKDKQNKRITANDFFSYVLIKKSQLYNFVEDEFELLCSEAESLLDWQEFVNVYESFDKEDWTDERKRSELSGNCLILNEKPTSSEK